jgi:hypothetical protein
MEYKAWECCGDVPAQTHENQYKKRASQRLKKIEKKDVGSSLDKYF